MMTRRRVLPPPPLSHAEIGEVLLLLDGLKRQSEGALDVRLASRSSEWRGRVCQLAVDLDERLYSGQMDKLPTMDPSQELDGEELTTLALLKLDLMRRHHFQPLLSPSEWESLPTLLEVVARFDVHGDGCRMVASWVRRLLWRSALCGSRQYYLDDGRGLVAEAKRRGKWRSASGRARVAVDFWRALPADLETSLPQLQLAALRPRGAA